MQNQKLAAGTALTVGTMGGKRIRSKVPASIAAVHNAVIDNLAPIADEVVVGIDPGMMSVYVTDHDGRGIAFMGVPDDADSEWDRDKDCFACFGARMDADGYQFTIAGPDSLHGSHDWVAIGNAWADIAVRIIFSAPDEATCLKCGETFIPDSPTDLTHIETEAGQECGGRADGDTLVYRPRAPKMMRRPR